VIISLKSALMVGLLPYGGGLAFLFLKQRSMLFQFRR
jgi:hypothetical protein